MFTNRDAQPCWPSPTEFMTRNKLLRREKKTTLLEQAGKGLFTELQRCRAGPSLAGGGAHSSLAKQKAWHGTHKDLAFPEQSEREGFLTVLRVP